MRKNKLILLLIILFLMIFICLAIKINRADNLSENKKEVDEYEQTIIKLADIEQSKEKEEAIVKIIDDDANTIFITNKDIEFFKVLNSTENNAEELVIENKIYSIEAQKKGILLSDDSINEIENICNSNEILDYVQNDDKVRDNFKKRIKTYLTDNEYKQALNDRILYEIYNNCISISNEEINEKMKEYINVKEDFKKIENPSEEERADCLNKTATLLFEIQDLYLQNIKDKYLIETIK